MRLACSSRLTAGAAVEVARLFAIFQDSCREHDGLDLTHGERAAEYAVSLQDVLFDLTDAATFYKMPALAAPMLKRFMTRPPALAGMLTG